MPTLDLPPLWLAVFVAVVWIMPWSLHSGPLVAAGIVCLVIAAALTVAALVEFARARTSVIPHRTPDALITTGVFGWSRNPIYLADLLILAGLALIWGKLPGLVLVPVLAVLLERRFIRAEEARMRDAFGEAFENYMRSTRRWL